MFQPVPAPIPASKPARAPVRLAFPGWRRGFFKATGGPITEALRRGHQVHLFHGAAGKPGENVPLEEIRARWPGACLHAAGAPGRPPRVDAVLGPSLHAYAARLPRGAQYGLDLRWEQIPAPPSWRRTPCFASAYQRACWEHGRPGWRCTGVVTGSPMLDAFEGGRIRTDPPAVVLMALKFPGNSGLWRRLWYRHAGYRL